MTGSVNAVRVRGLTRRFGERAVIDDLDLDIAAGEFVALVGASGCGKSTLLRVLADLDNEIDGEVVVPLRRAVAFQAPRLMPWKRVWQNVTLGLPGGESRDRAAPALEEVGLSHRADVWPKVLSGGEAQRASLARALMRDPELLLLDEPFGALDEITRQRMNLELLRIWAESGTTAVLVTHSIAEAVFMADTVFVMSARPGRLSGKVEIPLPRPRTLGMMRSPEFFRCVNQVRDGLFGREAEEAELQPVESW